MRELQLDEIKEIELSVLRHFDAFCREHNIKYFLSNGTLLGAVKYEGFIPWDDDIDVLLPRKDYDRLMEIYPKEGNFKLLSYERDPNSVFPFAKLYDTSTVIKNQTRLKDYIYGVHIDIFPLDVLGDDFVLAAKTAKKSKRLTQKLSFSVSYYTKGRSFLRTCIKALCITFVSLRGYKAYKRKFLKQMKNVPKNEEGKFVGCILWSIRGKKEIFPAEIFADTVELNFEGESYPAPVGYDAYLRQLYGNYEQDPPLEKQKSHHRFAAYRL